VKKKINNRARKRKHEAMLSLVLPRLFSLNIRLMKKIWKIRKNTPANTNSDITSILLISYSTVTCMYIIRCYIYIVE